MFRVIQLFVFLFGRIVHRTIRIRPNSLKPLFGTSLPGRAYDDNCSSAVKSIFLTGWRG